MKPIHNSLCDMEHKKRVKIFMMFPDCSICATSAPPRRLATIKARSKLPSRAVPPTTTTGQRAPRDKGGKCHLHLWVKSTSVPPYHRGPREIQSCLDPAEADTLTL